MRKYKLIKKQDLEQIKLLNHTLTVSLDACINLLKEKEDHIKQLQSEINSKKVVLDKIKTENVSPYEVTVEEYDYQKAISKFCDNAGYGGIRNLRG